MTGAMVAAPALRRLGSVPCVHDRLRKDGIVAKHLLDVTAEFALPRAARHARPDDEPGFEPTLRFDAGFRPSQPKPDPRQDARTR